jgi:hypothetical protein
MIARAVSTTRRRWPLLLAGLLVLTSVLFAGLWLGAANAGSSRANVFSGVPVNEFDAADSRPDETLPACATETWTDVPGATVTFIVGGTTSAPVLATVSVREEATAADAFVRLLIDDVPNRPGNLIFETPSLDPYSHPVSYTFVTLPLTPGPHTAKIQYQFDRQSGNVEPAFCLEHWTLAILHT